MKTLDTSHQNDLFGTESLELMSSRGGSHVRTYPSQENRLALKAHALVCGGNTHDLLAKLDPSTQSWRTCQHSFLESEGDGLERFLETWPESGTMQDGVAYRHPTVAHPISATGYGFLPTPTASHYWSNRSTKTSKVRPSLYQMATNNMWPTPTARAWKGARKPETLAAKGRNHTNTLEDAIRATTEGKLSPKFVEWLMGYPIGWTHLNQNELPAKRRKEPQG